MSKQTGRDAVLQVARDLFTSKGFASTTVRQVCQAAGVTAPVLYYHFGSKEGLFEAVVKDALSLDAFCDILREEVAGSTDPWTKLQGYVRAYLIHYPVDAFNPGLHQTNSTQVCEASLRQLSSGIHTMYQVTRNVLQFGVDAGAFREIDVDTMAVCLMGTMNSFVEAKVYLGIEYDLERVVACIMDLFTHGLVARFRSNEPF